MVCGKREYGGQDWGEAAIMRAYLKLSAACLATTFVITQRTGAHVNGSRLSEDETDIKRRLLARSCLVGGNLLRLAFLILTTSRRHAEASGLARGRKRRPGLCLMASVLG